MENQFDASDWRSQFKRRETIRNKIIVESNALLNKMLQLEEQLFAEATCQSDYRKKVASKMVAMGMNVGNLVGDQRQGSASHSPVGDWREEAYEKIQNMRDLYFDEVVRMFDDVTLRLGKVKENEVDGLRKQQYYLLAVAKLLKSTKEEIKISHKGKLEKFEENLVKFFSIYREN